MDKPRNPTRRVTSSAFETADLAAELARTAQPGDVYALTGPLGAGKTVFTQGFARGLGYESPVTSPTFTLMNICEGGRLTLYHFDLYRLTDGVDGLEGIGYEDYLYADGISLIEWADRAADLLPEHTIWVDIAPDDNNGGDFRRIVIR